jgi:hypothetical protein
VVLEAAPRHELVDEQALLVLAAVPQQLHEVPVPELAEEDDLGEPLAVALEPAGVELLHGDGLRVQPGAHAGVHEALVHGAEPALAQQVAAREVVRHAAELAQAERVQLQRARRLLLLGLAAAAPVLGGRGGAVGQGREPAEGGQAARQLGTRGPAPRQALLRTGRHHGVLRRAALGRRRQHRSPRPPRRHRRILVPSSSVKPILSKVAYCGRDKGARGREEEFLQEWLARQERREWGL